MIVILRNGRGENGDLQFRTSQLSSRNDSPVAEPNRVLQPIHRKQDNHLERRLAAFRRLVGIRIDVHVECHGRIRFLRAETSRAGRGGVLVADAHRPAEVQTQLSEILERDREVFGVLQSCLREGVDEGFGLVGG